MSTINQNLPIILSLIGCVTGIASLAINFYKALNERCKLKFESPQDKNIFFPKLKHYERNRTNNQGIAYIRFINKSATPITIYGIETKINDKNLGFTRYKSESIRLLREIYSENEYSEISISMTHQITLPLKIDSYSVYQGYIFFEFFPDSDNDIETLNFTIKTSRKILKSSCNINKFETKVHNN